MDGFTQPHLLHNAPIQFLKCPYLPSACSLILPFFTQSAGRNSKTALFRSGARELSSATETRSAHDEVARQSKNRLRAQLRSASAAAPLSENSGGDARGCA
eukprot:2880416-Pleurochrysis_carterae.AAC.1